MISLYIYGQFSPHELAFGLRYAQGPFPYQGIIVKFIPILGLPDVKPLYYIFNTSPGQGGGVIEYHICVRGVIWSWTILST